MPKVQVDLSDEVHALLRVEAARRGLSLAAAVAALTGEALSGEVAAKPRPVAVATEWTPGRAQPKKVKK